nr:hypothetical protein [uncultured Chryseobacterium sp.]
MKKIPRLGCGCEKATQSPSDYRTSIIGTDSTHNRNADVSIVQCKLCQRIWILYTLESEDSPQSGRWFKGIVSKKYLSTITPENAIEYLENLDWYIYGGSYFESTEAFGQGKLLADF